MLIIKGTKSRLEMSFQLRTTPVAWRENDGPGYKSDSIKFIHVPPSRFEGVRGVPSRRKERLYASYRAACDNMSLKTAP